MEDNDSSCLSASLQPARRLPDLVAEGWEGRGEKGSLPSSATFILWSWQVVSSLVFHCLQRDENRSL